MTDPAPPNFTCNTQAIHRTAASAIALSTTFFVILPLKAHHVI